MATYYHVTTDRYEPGSDLLCWDSLIEQGIVTEEDWKWDEAPVGFDGGVVCLWETESEAREFQAEHGGVLLSIEIEDGNDEIRLTTVSEGFRAALYSIPSYAITVVE